MNLKIGFIGSGNMGTAMISGIVKSQLVSSTNVIVSDINEEKLKKIKEECKVQITSNNISLAKQCDVIVLSVKPHVYSVVIDEIKDVVNDNVIIISIAAGQTKESVREMFGRNLKVAKCMPNTPALVGEAMTAISVSENMSEEDIKTIQAVFNSFGKSEIVDESMMDAVTAVSGSSPAYVYMFIEALADGAVVEGMPREQAYKFASQAVLGAAKMVLETGQHPGQLKDQVCSPGGTTIAAVAKLEETGLRNSVLKAMNACIEKSVKMTQK